MYWGPATRVMWWFLAPVLSATILLPVEVTSSGSERKTVRVFEAASTVTASSAASPFRSATFRQETPRPVEVVARSRGSREPDAVRRFALVVRFEGVRRQRVGWGAFAVPGRGGTERQHGPIRLYGLRTFGGHHGHAAGQHGCEDEQGRDAVFSLHVALGV